MKILLVEDHLTFGPSMAALLRDIPQVAEVSLATNRTAAIEALGSDFYDLLILDLSIPMNDVDLEVAKENGHAVFYESRRLCPGIKTFILTGSEMDDFAKGLSAQGDQVDLWGKRATTNTLDYFEKENADRLFTEVAEVASEVANLDAIVLNSRGRRLDLTPGQLRCIRIAARRFGAAAVEVVPLSGGLSSARVIRATMRNGAGNAVHATVAKLGTKREIEVEVAAYHAHAKSLPLGFFAPLTETVEKGACGAAGAFYTLAEGYTLSLFDVLAQDDKAAAGLALLARQRMGIWSSAAHMVDGSIADIRQRVLWRETFDPLVAKHGLDVSDIEARGLRYRVCCLHGDLHGGNVLVDASGNPVLIDYGDVGPGAAAIDPVMLDLSCTFHPDAVRLGISANILPLIELWPDPDAYIAHHPYPLFAKVCREWAYDMCGHDLAVLGSAYAYVLRQLRYAAVAPATTLAALNAITDRVRAT